MPTPSARRALLLALILAPWHAGLVVSAEESEPDAAYVEVDRLNAGLPSLVGLDLGTPQAALENYVLACERGDYATAAHSLNLNAIDVGRQAELGPRLARQLKEVMDRQVWFRWDEVPDRADGQEDEASIKKEVEGKDGPQSSIRLGALFIGDRDFEIRLERIRPGGREPIWVVSRQTVKHIPILHAAFGPSWIERYVPGTLNRVRFAKIRLWQWIGFAIFLSAGYVLGRVAQKGLDLLSRREWPWVRAVAEALKGPGTLALGLWTFYVLARKVLNLAGPVLSMIDPLYIAVLVASLVWFLQRLIATLSARIRARYAGRHRDEANVLITRIEVVQHLLTFAVIVGGAIVVLGRFEWFRQVGVMLLASAGISGLILGIAAHRVLGNVFAGLLLAITQPVKSGDAVIFEGEFGWVEEIALTYLVLATWDQRRLVVPISYFLDKPIQNWSRRSQQLLMPVMVFADYRVDVQAVREELRRIMEGSEEWDRAVPPILEVTDCSEETIGLRALCSAGDPASSWHLRCRVRERLIAYIQGLEGGRYLPRKRVALVGDDRDGPAVNEPGRPQASAVASNGQGDQ